MLLPRNLRLIKAQKVNIMITQKKSILLFAQLYLLCYVLQTLLLVILGLYCSQTLLGCPRLERSLLCIKEKRSRERKGIDNWMQSMKRILLTSQVMFWKHLNAKCKLKHNIEVTRLLMFIDIDR